MQKVNLLKCINYAINEYRANGLSERFQQLCKEVIDTNNPGHNIKFAKCLIKVAHDLDVQAHGRVILEYGSAEDNYDFARLFRKADSRAHREKIIESGSVEYNLYAGVGNEIKDKLSEEFVNRHGEIVAQYGGVIYNYNFLKNNKTQNLDKKPHITNIIESNSSLFNLKVAKNVAGIDIEPHSAVVARLGTAYENFQFLFIEGCNRKRHLTAIVKSEDVEINLRCLIQLKTSEINLAGHLKVVFKSSDNQAKYEVVTWAQQKGILKELVKYMPEIGEFINDIKTKKIVLKVKYFRFLNQNLSALNH